MVTVYYHPLSPYGQKVKMALLEKGIEFEAVMPDAIGSGTTDVSARWACREICCRVGTTFKS